MQDKNETPIAVTPASIAEAQRQGAAELAHKMRQRLVSRSNTRATLICISEVIEWLDELAPPDNAPDG